jgi:hypothetical protein
MFKKKVAPQPKPQGKWFSVSSPNRGTIEVEATDDADARDRAMRIFYPGPSNIGPTNDGKYTGRSLTVREI